MIDYKNLNQELINYLILLDKFFEDEEIKVNLNNQKYYYNFLLKCPRVLLSLLYINTGDLWMIESGFSDSLELEYRGVVIVTV